MSLPLNMMQIQQQKLAGLPKTKQPHGEDERYDASPSRISDGPRIDIIAPKRDGEKRSRLSKHSNE